MTEPTPLQICRVHYQLLQEKLLLNLKKLGQPTGYSNQQADAFRLICEFYDAREKLGAEHCVSLSELPHPEGFQQYFQDFFRTTEMAALVELATAIERDRASVCYWFHKVEGKPFDDALLRQHLVARHGLTTEQAHDLEYRDAVGLLKKDWELLHPDNSPPRLCFEADTCTVTLDGAPYESIDPTAVRLLKAINDGIGNSGAARRLDSVPGLLGKRITRELDKLPAPLRNIVRSKQGNGRWIELPPL